MEVILDIAHCTPVYHPAFPRILAACWAVTQLFAPGERAFLKVLIGGNKDWLHVYAAAKSSDPISSFFAAQAILERATKTKLLLEIRSRAAIKIETNFENDEKVCEAYCRFSIGTDEGPVQYSDEPYQELPPDRITRLSTTKQEEQNDVRRRQ